MRVTSPSNEAKLADGRTITLIDDAVLIKLEAPERMTASKKLYIPDNAKREAYELYQATVIAAGPGALRMKDGARNPAEIQAGDRVLIYWAAGELEVTALFQGADELRIISEKSIQAVIG